MNNVSSGISALDDVLNGLRYGDNVVFQVDSLSDYLFFTEPLVKRAIEENRKCIYIRFASHSPVVEKQPGVEIVEVNFGQGFDQFSRAVHNIIEENGTRVYYILDNLSTLVEEWATDELLANFFQVICPHMAELDCITYFALTRGKHAHDAIARIRDTTQVLVDIYRVEGRMYIHPLKVWDRYSPQMFLPHLMEGDTWKPIFESGEAAAVSVGAIESPLGTAIGSLAPWDSVYERLKSLSGKADEKDPEIAALKQELGHMMVSNHQDFLDLVDRYFDSSTLLGVRSRMVGSGRIGGKAAGMLLARQILSSRGDCGGVEFKEIMDDHDSFYIGSDVFFTFLVENNLFRLRLQMTDESSIGEEEFRKVEKRFLEGSFSHSIMEQFRGILDYYGQAPIIIRSSSLLEDSFGNSFAGKYRSEFCANQGTPEERLKAFLNAIKLVYASALNPDAIAYRRTRGLGDSDEQMAILVQRVSGFRYNEYFFPPMAGVAFSRNLYAWTDRIDRKQGMIRLVVGLGTRAVDRVGNDYPRMIAISDPEMRPESSAQVSKYSQHHMDLLDLKNNSLATMPVGSVLSSDDYPGLGMLVSFVEEGYLVDPVAKNLPARHGKLVLTFNNLIGKTGIVGIFKAMLTCLEEAYKCPVDIEFTAMIGSGGGIRVNLLQCRPLFESEESFEMKIPDKIEPEKLLFQSTSMVNGGKVENIRYLLYIDPGKYNKITDDHLRYGLGRLVGRINRHPGVMEGKVAMIGPGRWGSTNIELGVNVGYADINNASVLVELAREEAGHVPEVSYGTHFFQDIVEDNIIYTPVWPGDPESSFNEKFFEEAPDVLLELIPDSNDYAGLVKVIDVPSASKGGTCEMIADPQSRKAVLYLTIYRHHEL